MADRMDEKSPEHGEQTEKWIETPGMRIIIDQAVPDAASALLSDNDPVLLMAPSGTGKSYIKDKILQAAQISADAYVHVNCAAFSESLIESELFGHKKGSFTGAVQDHPGLLDLPDKKLLVLDEINSLPKHLQAKLLIFLDSGEYRQVGGTDIKQSQIKIIGISNSDPQNDIFRPDFYYRFKVIEIPPLHKRRLDILVLLKNLCPEIIWTGRELLRLLSYNWPGNVRELTRFCRLVNRHCYNIQEFMASEGQGPLGWLHILFSRGSHDELMIKGIPSIDRVNFFIDILANAPGMLWKRVSPNFPNLRLTSDAMVNLNKNAKVDLLELGILSVYAGQAVDDKAQMFWSSEWHSFCEMFFQASDTNSDILENIIEGRITETGRSTLSGISCIDEEEWADLPPIFRDRYELKPVIRGHFFNQPKNKPNDDFSRTKIEKIEGLPHRESEEKKYFESFFERHTPQDLEDMWLQHQIDNNRGPSEIAHHYHLNRKTVAGWLTKHRERHAQHGCPSGHLDVA